jgi:Fe(3+) dicitrate transport protein
MSQRNLIVFFWLISNAVVAQDTLQVRRLKEITIQSHRLNIDRMSEVHSTYLLGSRKNEVINVLGLDASIAEKTPRQIFAKVPGVFVYDMDGTGNQMNISTRGLDPHRGWEFNTRLNNAITNSDMYGYPASHFSLPMEAVESIQLVRGTGSLQYGAQFGGMINYVTKKPDSVRSFVFETINTMGSFGLISTYNAAGGTIGKFRYYVFFSKRISDGYRDNSKSDYDGESLRIEYLPNKNLRFRVEVSRSNYMHQVPGPLTDSMFQVNPLTSTRSRNYFNPEIYIPAVTMNWRLGHATTLSWLTSAVLGKRNSVLFDNPATVKDEISPLTNEYAARQVDIDGFNSYTSELRVLHRYHFFGTNNILVAGVQLINNDLHRRQLGKGTTGTDFDLSVTEPVFGRDLHFKTKNIAFFVENNFHVTEKLSVSPGARFETGDSEMTGVISYYDPGELPNSIDHRFPLFGITSEYKITFEQSIYAGWSQAYRPVIFKDIIPASAYERVDRNLEDASGYNLELGYRGSTNNFRWDLGLFRIKYNNRFGSLAESGADGNFVLYRTNIGNATTNGAEIFVEYNFPVKDVNVFLFTSTSLFDARYQKAVIRSGNENIDIDGNKVESVPEVISRNGINIKFKQLSFSILHSYTASSFADALNTKKPSANGSVGLVPAYGILDLNSTMRFKNGVVLRINLNNVTNENYFTKRPQFYPGPGVWSSDGRSVNVTIGIKI